MSAIRRTPKRRRTQRGSVLAMTGIAMILLVGMAVVGVDVGHLAFTANEAQSLADVGATAGARAMAERLSIDPSIDPAAQARLVMSSNAIGGGAATNANVESITYGNWVTGTGFQGPADLTDADAIEVVTTDTVDNFFAGMFGDAQSTVRRRAVGHIEPPSCAPVLPVAIGDCYFDFDDPSDCGNLPTLHMVPPNLENTCWSSVNGINPASASAFRSILPTQCCGQGQCGGGQQPPVVNVGDPINVQNGAVAAALQVLEGCINQDPPIDFVVPIIACNSGGSVTCTGQGTIVGFAVANVVAVQATGNPKGIDLEFKCGVTPSCAGGTGTPGEFGGFTSAMVE